MFEVPVNVVCDDGFVPTYAHEGDAVADMSAAIPEPVMIQPGASEWVGTGVRKMISDDERREVAEKLRAEAESWRCYREDDSAFCMSDSEFTESVLEDFGIDDMETPAYEVFNQMADIVDRQTCHDVADFDRESFKCSRCGFRVLSIDGTPDAAKLVGTKGGVIDLGFCPNCGAEVVEEGGCDVPEL